MTSDIDNLEKENELLPHWAELTRSFYFDREDPDLFAKECYFTRTQHRLLKEALEGEIVIYTDHLIEAQIWESKHHIAEILEILKTMYLQVCQNVDIYENEMDERAIKQAERTAEQATAHFEDSKKPLIDLDALRKQK